MKKPNLDKIIAKNLDKTGHIPNKGLTSIPNRKGTIPLVSNDGYKQGVPPQGYNYRIPSDTLYNPTPYRIKATPNNGPAKWLEPYTNQNIEFPGADYVDEQHFQNGGILIKAQKGLQFPPIYVNNPNDPRLKSYNDSLSLYNFTQLQKQLEKKENNAKEIVNPSLWQQLTGNYNRLTTEGQRKQNILKAEALKAIKNSDTIKSGVFSSPIKAPFAEYNNRGSYDIYSEKIKPLADWIGYAKNNDYSNVNPQQQIILGTPPQKTTVTKKVSNTKVKFNSWKPLTPEIAKGHFSGDIKNAQYRETGDPDHPYEITYKDNEPQPEPKIKHKNFNVQPIRIDKNYNPQITQLQRPSINLPPIQNGKYRVEYYDPSIRDATHQNFMTQAESDAFTKELGQRRMEGTPSAGNITQRMEYAYGGNYISDRAQATQFGQYKRGGGMFPEYHSFAPPRMDEGGWLNQYNNNNEYMFGNPKIDGSSNNIPVNPNNSYLYELNKENSTPINLKNIVPILNITNKKSKSTIQPTNKYKLTSLISPSNNIQYGPTVEGAAKIPLELPNVTVNSSQFKRFNRPITESTAIQIFDPVNNKFKSTASSHKLPGKIGKGLTMKDFVKNLSAAGSLFPHPYVKIPSMMINAGIGSYDTYNNLKEEDYLNAGINAAGVVPWGAIPGLGIYGKVGEIAGATADFTNNFGLENKKYGGGLLSKTVTCSNCGWSWKSVDGGKDVMTCHKCGGMIKMKHGGDISIPDLQEGNWLNKYQVGGPSFINTLPNNPLMNWVTHKPTTTDLVSNTIDPTGLSNVPFVFDAGRKMFEDPSWKNAGNLAWNLAGSIPGGLGTGIRDVRNASKIKKATTASNAVIKARQIGTKYGTPIVQGGRYIMDKGTKLGTFPARVVDAGWKAAGVTPVVGSGLMHANLWNRGGRGYNAGFEGLVGGLDYLFPGTPQKKQGGQNNNWLSKYDVGGENEGDGTILKDKKIGEIQQPIKTLNLRPTFPNNFPKTNIQIVDPNCSSETGVGCSYQATREAMKITGLPIASYAPANAGYRDAVAERYGLQNIFDQADSEKRTANSKSRNWIYPSTDDFKKFKAGDVIVLDSGKDLNDESFPYEAPPGFTKNDMTRSTHNGVIVGFTENGTPIIRHGYATGKKGYGKQITEVLGKDNRVTDLGHGRYAIKSVWRPKEVNEEGNITSIKTLVDTAEDQAKRKATSDYPVTWGLKSTNEEKLQNEYPVAAAFSGATNRLDTKNNLVNLFNNKQLDKELQYQLGISSEILQNLKPVVYGIAGQETNFNDIDNPLAAAKDIPGNLKNSNNSKGLFQIKYNSLTDDEKKILGIKSPNDLLDDKKAYKAAILMMYHAKNRMDSEVEKGTHPGLMNTDPFFRASYYYNQPKRATSTAEQWAQGSNPVVAYNPTSWLNSLVTRKRPNVFGKVNPNYVENTELRMDKGSYPYKLREKANDLLMDNSSSQTAEGAITEEPIVLYSVAKGKGKKLKMYNK